MRLKNAEQAPDDEAIIVGNPLEPVRLEFTALETDFETEDIVKTVVRGLTATPKTLPSYLFYDRQGSALFEAITGLPEYYLTRTEQAILNEFAPEIVARVSPDFEMVELGSGNSSKTRTLIDAALAYQSELHYTPIDISADFLRETAHGLLEAYPRLHVHAVAAEYFAALGMNLRQSAPRLFVFLGSNLGNFDVEAANRFLAAVRAAMGREDRLLIGLDLVKSRDTLVAAYDDAQGVTAEFNKNLLVRLNREVGTDFDLNQFDHRATWNAQLNRMEMRLVSRRAQTVHLPSASLSVPFAEGESIHTENSHKYTLTGFEQMARRADLSLVHHWTDPREWFALCLLKGAE